MAAKIVSTQNPENLRIAQLEKRAVDFIDQSLSETSNSLVFLCQINDFGPWRESMEMRHYVGENPNDILRFLLTRNHLWEFLENNVIKKVDPGIRQVLLQILRYVQKKTTGERFGAQLQDISSHVGGCNREMRKAWGKGYEGIKSFLSQYPHLFLFHPFHDEGKPGGEMLIINKSLAMDDDTIIFCKENGDSLDQLSYLKGTGTVMTVGPAFGFLRDDQTQEEVYFTREVFGKPQEKNLLKLVGPDRKFSFEAVISANFKEGNVTNRWKAFRLEPSLGGSDPAKDAVGATRTVLVQPQSLTVSVKTEKKLSSASSSSASTNKSAIKPKMEELDHAKARLADLDQQFRSIDIAMPFVADCGHYSHDLVWVTHAQAQGSCEPAFRQIPDVLPSGGQDSAVLSKNRPGATHRGKRGGRKMREKAEMALVKTPVPTCSVACQTEFNDEREILLRMLRQSPDLLKLVKIVKSQEYS